MGRPVSFDFTTGGGSPEEFLMGTVHLEPTLMHTIGNTVVLPDAPYPVKLVNGKAVHPNVAVSPAGPEPAWAYKVTIENELTGKAWSEFRGVPTGTTQIAYKDLTKFVTTVPPQTTAGMMQNWADTTEANAERSEIAADRAEAPTDLMNKTLIENSASLTAGALSAAIGESIAPGGTARSTLEGAIDGRVGDIGTVAGADIVGQIANVAPFPRTSKLSAIPSRGILPALTNTRAKASALKAGTGTLKVLCIGDSTTHGNDSSLPAGPWNPGSWPTQAAHILTDDGYPAGSGFGIAPSYASVNIDGRWALGAGWSQLKTPNIGFGSGVCIRTSNAAAATGTADFTPGFAYDRVDVYYTISSNPSFQAAIDVIVGGVTLGQIDTTGASTFGIGKLTVTPATATSAPVKLDAVSGAAIYIVAIDCHTAHGKIQIANAGVAGSTTSEWKNDTDTYASLDCIRAYAPDLTIINLGINDSGWNMPVGRAVAGVIADLTTLGDAVKATGSDVVLCSFVPSAEGSDKSPAAQLTYFPAIRDLAASKGWGFLDIAPRFQSFPVADARGWMSDLVHPGTTGYRDMAEAFADMLETVLERA